MTIPPFRHYPAIIPPNSQERGERRRGYSAAVLSPLGGGGINRVSGDDHIHAHSAAIPPETDHQRRDFHRPPTAEARRAAIVELLRQGLRPLDISATMRLPIGEVLEAARAAAVDEGRHQGRP